MLEGASIPQPKPYAVYGNPVPPWYKPTLGILICHLENRKALLERLLACLKPQLGFKATDFIGERYFESLDMRVQVIIEADNGKITTGEKRNKLLARSEAQWICSIDDDDEISPRFVELILKALESNPDCVSLEGEMDCFYSAKRRFSHSLRHGPVWREEKDGQKRFLRPPNHLNTVRTTLAREAGFPNKVVGEDLEYSQRLFPLLKTESVVNEILYFYHA